MKKKKANTILYIIVFIFVFVMFIATSFAYYNKVIKKNNENVETNNFNMLVMFNKSNVINASNLKNGYEEEIEFSVENFSEDTIGKYNIIFEVVTPLSNMVDEDFVYTLEGTSISKDTSNKIVNVNETPVPVLTKTIGTASITPKNTHTYKLKINLKNNNYSKNSLFNTKIKITIDN